MNSLIKIILIGLPLLYVQLVNAGSQLTLQVTDQQGKPLADAVVYAEAGKKTTNAEAPSAAIEQRNKQFMPLVTIVQTGASISFPNNDKVRHHVYSFSPAKTFELKLYSGKPSAPVVFDKPGVITLGCNIHDQMLAFVYVVDTPYFAKTDQQGKAILNLPNGEYQLKSMHYATAEQNSIVEQTLSVQGPQNLVLKIPVDPAAIVLR